MKSLQESDVKRLLNCEQVVEAIENAFRERYTETVMPVRTHINVEGGIFLIMPCYDREARGLGMKLIMVSDRPAVPEEKIHANYLLLDPANGHPRLLIAANYLTDIRTAAVSAVATRHLARQDARVLGIFGTGRQARSHLQVVRKVRKFESILVSGVDPAQTRDFAQEMAQEFGAKVESVYPRACAAESDVLCTCTTSSTPLFDGNVIRSGTHINAIGSFQPHTREIDDVTVRRARLVVDTYEGALAEAGDLLIPMNKGLISRSHIVADLHEMLTGKKRVRLSDHDITLFKSVGNALEDLAAAELLQEDQLRLSAPEPC
ncbi:MAG TPA: ornithine cyclodeaminase family protein [Terriglobales bacterium]|nr:ornithine cyclodeaminase family protein [Terriglobales bacterium]